jgi:hypothetical protein
MQPLKYSINVLRPKHIRRKRETKVARKFVIPIRAVIEVGEISRPRNSRFE